MGKSLRAVAIGRNGVDMNVVDWFPVLAIVVDIREWMGACIYVRNGPPSWGRFLN
jgi:hypothetical protein